MLANPESRAGFFSQLLQESKILFATFKPRYADVKDESSLAQLILHEQQNSLPKDRACLLEFDDKQSAVTVHLIGLLSPNALRQHRIFSSPRSTHVIAANAQLLDTLTQLLLESILQAMVDYPGLASFAIIEEKEAIAIIQRQIKFVVQLFGQEVIKKKVKGKTLDTWAATLNLLQIGDWLKRNIFRDLSNPVDPLQALPGEKRLREAVTESLEEQLPPDSKRLRKYNPFEELPLELFINIIGFLPEKDVSKCELVSKKFLQGSRQEAVWQPIFKQYFLKQAPGNSRRQFIKYFEQEASDHGLDILGKRLLLLWRNGDYRQIKQLYPLETIEQFLFSDKDLFIYDSAPFSCHPDKEKFPKFCQSQLDRIVLFLASPDTRSVNNPAYQIILNDVYHYLIKKLDHVVEKRKKEKSNEYPLRRISPLLKRTFAVLFNQPPELINLNQVVPHTPIMNFKSYFWIDPLAIATALNNVTLVKRLLVANVKRYAVLFHNTPKSVYVSLVYVAAYYQHTEMLEIYKDRTKDIFPAIKQALHGLHITVLQALLPYAPDAIATLWHAKQIRLQPVHWKILITESIMANAANLVEKLLAITARGINAKDNVNMLKSKVYWLHKAAYFGFIEIAKILIKYKANVNLVDHEKMTPIMHAVKGKHLNMVRLLNSEKADLFYRNSYGASALSMACKNGDIAMMNYLLRKAQEKGVEMDSPEVIALRNKLTKIVQTNTNDHVLAMIHDMMNILNSFEPNLKSISVRVG